MNSPLPVRRHPFRFLLQLEWVLLFLVLLNEIPIMPRHSMLRWRELNLGCLLAFGIMGLRLPAGGRWQKLLYAAIALGLILLASFAGGLRLFALLYVVFVIRNCLIFEGLTQSVMTGLAFLLALSTQIYRVQTFDRLPRIMPLLPRLRGADRVEMLLISTSLLLGLVLLFLQLLINAMLAERKSREQLATANQQLRQYALRIENVATLQERNRIAREIHDSLGHTLTVFNLHLEAALRLWQSNPAEAQALIVEAKQLGATTLQEVRQSVATLRTDPLQGKSLAQAIGDLAEDFQRFTTIPPDLQLSVTDLAPISLKTAIYRIVQEGLTNIYKYANATQVSIQLYIAEGVTLTIQDNGQGFQPEQITTGFGLQGMRERVLALNGTFEVMTAPDRGCQIVAKFPHHPHP
jgi:signal transduction histidine kinase